MGLNDPRTRGSSIDDRYAKKVSTNKLLGWLKKAVGLKPAIGHDQGRLAGRAVATNCPSRSRSFVLPGDVQDSETAKAAKPFFHHTTGAKAAVRPTLLVSAPHVLIIGAGLSGLCLAQGLKRVGIPFTVFEGDASTTSDASDGYNVHIDTTGYDALKVMLPDETFDLLLQSAGQAFPDLVQRDARSGKQLPDELLRESRGMNKQVFCIDRALLRTVLLHGLAEGSEVQYKRVFKNFRVLPNKSIEAHFANGLFARGTVLVGADGKDSRVRDQLVPPRAGGLLDTDCCVIYGKTRATTGLATAKLACISTTTFFTDSISQISLRIEPLQARGLGVAEVASEPAQRHSHRRRKTYHTHDDDDSFVHWALMARTGAFLVDKQMNIHDLDAMAPFQLADVAQRMTPRWHPIASAVVHTQSPEWCVFQRIHTTTAHVPAWSACGVTLVGDAAHVMAPGNCGGANLAFEDAAILCDRFFHVGVGLPAISMYDKQMRLTAQDAVLANVHENRQLIGMPPMEHMAPVAGMRKRSLNQFD